MKFFDKKSIMYYKCKNVYHQTQMLTYQSEYMILYQWEYKHTVDSQQKGIEVCVITKVQMTYLSSDKLKKKSVYKPSSMLQRTSLVIGSTAVNPPPKVENTSK